MRAIHVVFIIVCVAFAMLIGGMLLYRAKGYLDVLHIVYMILFGVLFGSILCAYIHHASPERFMSYQENLFPSCDWIGFIQDNTDPTNFSIRKSQQPTITTNVILVQEPHGPMIDMPTSMSASSSLSYILRVWVTASSVDALVQNNPFALVYLTATENVKQPIPIQFQVVYKQNQPYDALPGTQWFLLESSVVNVPSYATFVHWRLEPVQQEVHWADFQIQYKRSAQDFEPSIGLQALYSTFLPGFQLQEQLWKDESGFNANTYFDSVPTRQSKGIVIPGVWQGPLSSVLIGNANTRQSASNNLRDFTITFFYNPPRNVVPSSTTNTLTTLFTIYATYRNYFQHDNPPNFFFRVVLDTVHNMMCLQQQTTTQQPSGVFRTKQICVPLRNDMNEPVLYSIVVTASTRTTGDVSIFANTQLEVQESSWMDLNYNLNTNSNNRIVWGHIQTPTPTATNRPNDPINVTTAVVTTSTTTQNTRVSTNPVNNGVLYMFSAFNRALSHNEIVVLNQYVSRTYNVGTKLQLVPTPVYYTPVSVSVSSEQPSASLIPSSWTTNNDTGDSGLVDNHWGEDTIPNHAEPPPGQVACVQYSVPSPYSTDQPVDDVTCTYVDANDVSTQCPKDSISDNNTMMYPYPNHTCERAVQYVTQTTQHAQDMGMQWDTPLHRDGFVYRSTISDDTYNQMSPEEKMNVLNDVPFNRNYRVLHNEPTVNTNDPTPYTNNT